MKIISSYGVELRKQNIPIRQTLEIYRSAVRYLVEVYESVWEELGGKGCTISEIFVQKRAGPFIRPCLNTFYLISEITSRFLTKYSTPE